MNSHLITSGTYFTIGKLHFTLTTWRRCRPLPSIAVNLARWNIDPPIKHAYEYRMCTSIAVNCGRREVCKCEPIATRVTYHRSVQRQSAVRDSVFDLGNRRASTSWNAETKWTNQKSSEKQCKADIHRAVARLGLGGGAEVRSDLVKTRLAISQPILVLGVVAAWLAVGHCPLVATDQLWQHTMRPRCDVILRF